MKRDERKLVFFQHRHQSKAKTLKDFEVSSSSWLSKLIWGFFGLVGLAKNSKETRKCSALLARLSSQAFKEARFWLGAVPCLLVNDI